MSILKKIFSWRTMWVIVGTCICTWAILFTLFIIESGFFSDYGKTRWTSRAKEFDKLVSTKKEEVLFFTDTVYGTMFPFKDMLVIPLVEIKVDSAGERNRILNFKVYHTNTKTESNLFPVNQEIIQSKLIQAKDHLFWFMETKDTFYLYDSCNVDLVKSAYPSGYSFVYLSTFEIEGVEELNHEEERPAQTKEIKIPDTYLVHKTVPSFSIIGNQLLFYAQKDHDKRYWLYDLTTREIRELANNR